MLNKHADISELQDCRIGGWGLVWILIINSRVIGWIDEANQVAEQGGTISINEVESSQ